MPVTITVSDDFIERLQFWVERHGKAILGHGHVWKKLKIGRGSPKWDEITVSQAIDELLKEAGF